MLRKLVLLCVVPVKTAISIIGLSAHERSLVGVLIHYQKNAVASPVFNPWEAIGPLWHRLLSH